MKKICLLFMTVILCLLTASCVRIGERDSIDFLSAMHRRGYRCVVEETYSGELLKESCYVDGFKVSMFSEPNGCLVRVSITYADSENSGFSKLAADAVGAFCGFDSSQVEAVFSVLGIGDELLSDSGGVKRCDTQWYGFSFTCDEVGGALAVDSYRFNPTSAPDVTLNTTVPFIYFGSSEKSSS